MPRVNEKGEMIVAARGHVVRSRNRADTVARSSIVRVEFPGSPLAGRMRVSGHSMQR
jgi:hypothetical protein